MGAAELEHLPNAEAKYPNIWQDAQARSAKFWQAIIRMGAAEFEHLPNAETESFRDSLEDANKRSCKITLAVIWTGTAEHKGLRTRRFGVTQRTTGNA